MLFNCRLSYKIKRTCHALIKITRCLILSSTKLLLVGVNKQERSQMLKITMLILSGLIIYFFLRTRKGMSKIDTIYNKENSAAMKQKKLDQQKRLIKNKTFR